MRATMFAMIFGLSLLTPSLALSATITSKEPVSRAEKTLDEAARQCLPAVQGAGERMFPCDDKVFDRSLQMYLEAKENAGLIASPGTVIFSANPIALTREGWKVKFSRP